MSAGVCGKRVGFEEICGSSSPTSAKRSRCSTFGSLVRSGSDDPVSFLLQMFPDVDPEVRFCIYFHFSLSNYIVIVIRLFHL